ncbi:amidohydrolase [Allofournierella sp.]|uniref:amidohydrolase n=1 Tax=Allofournierella sp. TaxID=1940256 RepID=UPI003AB67AB9
MDTLQFIRQTAAEKAALISQVNRGVWQSAEFGYSETESSALIAQVLRGEGFAVQTGTGGLPTALEATWGQGAPVIGILGEYDALPNLSQEAGVAEPRPIPGQKCGHGCGHSALGAGAVGAALILKEWLQATGTAGTVKFFGCPAEETGFGKAFMAKAGCFAGLDAALTWHPMDMNAAMAVRTVAYYKVRFDFKGRTAHAGACPEQGRSALDACELMNVGVNYLREHIISQARVHYAYLDCGGDAPNVVQERASLLYFVRAPKLTDSAAILERIKKIAQGAALMTETEVTATVLGGLSDTVPNPTLSKLLSDSFTALGGPDFGEEEYAIARRYLAALAPEARAAVLAQGAKLNGVTEDEFALRPLNTAVIPFQPQMMAVVTTGSSDVGDVSYLVPTAQLTAATAIPGTGPHTWQFTGQVGTSIGDKGSQAAARAIALAAARLFEQPALLETAKQELLAETGGRYQSPIPSGISYTDVNPKTPGQA